MTWRSDTSACAQPTTAARRRNRFTPRMVCERSGLRYQAAGPEPWRRETHRKGRAGRRRADHLEVDETGRRGLERPADREDVVNLRAQIGAGAAELERALLEG